MPPKPLYDSSHDEKRRLLIKASAAIAIMPALSARADTVASHSGVSVESLQKKSSQQLPQQSSLQQSSIEKGRSVMSINTARFEYQNTIQWGVVREGEIIPIPGDFPTTGDFVNAVSVSELNVLEGNPIALSSVKILSPVTTNQRFVCQGANYRKHMIESGMNPDDKNFNMIFTKASSAMAPYNTDVIRPPMSNLLDYEVELGVVMRSTITGPVSVNSGNLYEHVAGIVVVNDITARDVQVPQMQFYKGKSFRTFGPIGPYLCLLDKNDMHYLDKLQLSLKVNGQVRQSDSTGDMVYRPAETITELSAVHDFSPGDLIATGTPAGCALTVPSPAKQKLAALIPEAVKWKLFLKMQSERTQYLKPGDQIETTIRSADNVIDLGMQKNTVVQG